MPESGRKRYADKLRGGVCYLRKYASPDGFSVTDGKLSYDGGQREALLVPETLEGKPVKCIPPFTVSGRGIRLVFIDGSPQIENKAFSGCPGLVGVFIKNPATAHSGAFPFKTRIFGPGAEDSAVIDDRGFIINAGKLISYLGLEGATIPCGVTEIGSEAFCGFGGAITFETNSRLKKIESYAFAGCGAPELEFPGTLEEVSENAFSLCGAKTITLPFGTAISSGSFSGNACIKTLSFSSRGLNNLGRAFGKRRVKGTERVTQRTGTGLEEFWVPRSLTSLFLDRAPDWFACGFANLKKAVVSGNVGKRAFFGCSSLAEATVSGSATVGEAAFFGTSLKILKLKDGAVLLPGALDGAPKPEIRYIKR